MPRHAPVSDSLSQGPDDLDAFLTEELNDPAFKAAYEDAGYRENLLRDLVARRKQQRLSQTVLAERMGTTQSAVSELEGSVGDPRLSTLQRYARALECRLQLAVCEDRPHHDRIYALPSGPAAPAAARLAASKYTVDHVEISASSPAPDVAFRDWTGVLHFALQPHVSVR